MKKSMKSNRIFETVDINVEKPPKQGYYIIDTSTHHSFNSFRAWYDGKNFDVTNQKVLNWYREIYPTNDTKRSETA